MKVSLSRGRVDVRDFANHYKNLMRSAALLCTFDIYGYFVAYNSVNLLNKSKLVVAIFTPSKLHLYHIDPNNFDT